MNENLEFIEVNKNYFEKLSELTAVRTHVWGPPAWFFLHSMAMAYPKKIDTNNPEHIKIRNSMYSFLSNLGNVLPCNLCGISYNGYIKEPDLEISKYLDSRAKLSYFIYLIHEKVNKKLGIPPCYRPSFKKVIKKYGNFLVGPDQCKITDIEQQIKKLIEGCEDTKINMDFKKYKSLITVIDKDTKEIEKFDIKENIDLNEVQNKNTKQGINYILFYLVLFLMIIFLISTIILLFLRRTA